MDHRSLDDALETSSRLGILTPVGNEIGKFRIDVLDQVPTQDVEIDVAGSHDRSRILVVDQGEQKMLQGRVFMPPLPCQGESTVKSLF
jgi:hypothetical protein